MKRIFIYSFAFTGIALLSTCTRESGTPDYKDFPQEIGRILVNKCATAGCHDNISKDAAAGLSLVSWDKMFEGGNSGSVVIPFRPDFSSLMYFVNTYDDLGVKLEPVMPLNNPRLTREEVITLRDWIAKGAPSADGTVKFSGDPNREKIYVTNQGCDVVTVFDAESGLPMRYIDVGTSPGIESPHMVKVSPDGKYWYVLSLNSQYLQRYRAEDDAFDSQILIGAGNWNTFSVSPDLNWAYCVDWSSSGKIAVVDLQNQTSTTLGPLLFPHGSALNPAGDTLYVTAQTGNYIYKIPVNDFASYSEIILEQPGTKNTGPSLDSHEILFSPDGATYFVTCQGTNEVRILRRSDDKLLAVIPTGTFPSEMAISKNSDYLFVTCPEETVLFPGKRGCITIINYKTNTFVKNIYAGHQPHGIAVDDERGWVYVVNTNYSADGPLPHHPSGVCSGRNGYVTFINLKTLELESSKKIEVATFPYSAAYRGN